MLEAMRYAGASVAQIERAIAKAAQVESPFELRDGSDVVVLSTSLPNDLHLEVSSCARKSSRHSQSKIRGGS